MISFYHDFRTNPVGRHVIKICRSEACQAVDGGALGKRVLDLLGLDWGGTTANGAVTVEPVYCLGMCACAPALMVDKTVHGRVDEAKIEIHPAGGRRMKIYVPCDSAAKALGADAVAAEIQAQAAARGIDITLVRNGTRGMIWLEPLVEVEGPNGRIAYGPVTPADVPHLFGDATECDCYLGLTDDLGLDAPPDAPDLCALRGDRPAVDRRLSRAWRVRRSGTRPWHGGRGDRG